MNKLTDDRRLAVVVLAVAMEVVLSSIITLKPELYVLADSLSSKIVIMCLAYLVSSVVTEIVETKKGKGDEVVPTVRRDIHERSDMRP